MCKSWQVEVKDRAERTQDLDDNNERLYPIRIFQLKLLLAIEFQSSESEVRLANEKKVDCT